MKKNATRPVSREVGRGESPCLGERGGRGGSMRPPSLGSHSRLAMRSRYQDTNFLPLISGRWIILSGERHERLCVSFDYPNKCIGCGKSGSQKHGLGCEFERCPVCLQSLWFCNCCMREAAIVPAFNLHRIQRGFVTARFKCRSEQLPEISPKGYKILKGFAYALCKESVVITKNKRRTIK